MLGACASSYAASHSHGWAWEQVVTMVDVPLPDQHTADSFCTMITEGRNLYFISRLRHGMLTSTRSPHLVDSLTDDGGGACTAHGPAELVATIMDPQHMDRARTVTFKGWCAWARGAVGERDSNSLGQPLQIQWS